MDSFSSIKNKNILENEICSSVKRGKLSAVLKNKNCLRANKGIFRNNFQFAFLGCHAWSRKAFQGRECGFQNWQAASQGQEVKGRLGLFPVFSLPYILLYMKSFFSVFSCTWSYIESCPSNPFWGAHQRLEVNTSTHEDVSLWSCGFHRVVICLHSLLCRCWQNTVEIYAQNQMLHWLLYQCLVCFETVLWVGLFYVSVEDGKQHGNEKEFRDYPILLLS